VSLAVTSPFFLYALGIFAFAGAAMLVRFVVRCFMSKLCSFLLFREKISYTRTCSVPHEQLFIKNSRGESLDFWWLPNPQSSEAILYLHGNMGRLPHFFTPLQKEHNVLAPSYPGYGLSEGRPCDDCIYETAELAYRWLLAKGFRDEQITIWGHSLGGAPATWLASRHPKRKKLVVINSFCSVKGVCKERFGLVSLLVHDRFNSSNVAREVEGRVVVCCYKDDKTIPYASCRKLYESFATPDKTLVELHGHTHEYFDIDATLKP
jgi:uncharacterized protein